MKKKKSFVRKKKLYLVSLKKNCNFLSYLLWLKTSQKLILSFIFFLKNFLLYPFLFFDLFCCFSLKFKKQNKKKYRNVERIVASEKTKKKNIHFFLEKCCLNSLISGKK